MRHSERTDLLSELETVRDLKQKNHENSFLSFFNRHPMAMLKIFLENKSNQLYFTLSGKLSGSRIKLKNSGKWAKLTKSL